MASASRSRRTACRRRCRRASAAATRKSFCGAAALVTSRSSGFTLIEGLVALAIVAIALAAAARASSLSSSAAGEVKLRVLAGLVAENRLSELAARRAWPALGAVEGTEQQAGIDFAWRVEVTSTPHPLFRRVEVHVLSPAEPGRELRRLIGVLPREPN